LHHAQALQFVISGSIVLLSSNTSLNTCLSYLRIFRKLRRDRNNSASRGIFKASRVPNIAGQQLRNRVRSKAELNPTFACSKTYFDWSLRTMSPQVSREAQVNWPCRSIISPWRQRRLRCVSKRSVRVSHGSKCMTERGLARAVRTQKNGQRFQVDAGVLKTTEVLQSKSIYAQGRPETSNRFRTSSEASSLQSPPTNLYTAHEPGSAGALPKFGTTREKPPSAVTIAKRSSAAE